MKPVALKSGKPEESRGFSKQNPQGKPDQSLAFAFAFAPADQEPRSRSTDFVGMSDLWKCGSRKIKPTSRPVVRFPQLCAITKEQFQPDGGWKDAIISRVIAIGFACPEPEQVRRAMEAIDHVHKLSALSKAKPARMTCVPEVRSLSVSESKAMLAKIFQRVSA